MEGFAILGISGALIFVLMTLLWVVYLFQKNAAIVDVGWAVGFLMSVGVFSWMAEGYWFRKLLIAVMVAVWAGRLGGYLLLRFLKSGEDPRYRRMQDRWTGNVSLQVYLMFLFQGLLIFVLSLPFFVICLNESVQVSVWEGVGFLVWLGAVVGEALADYQLSQFKMESGGKGKVCQKGLWNYSRHPNYFFEWLVWVGFSLFAMGSPFGWMGWIAQGLMLYLLLGLSGVPLAEEQALLTKGEEYRQYQRTTSVFVPWFKKEC